MLRLAITFCAAMCSMVIGPYALAQAPTPGGLQPGEVRVRVDFEIKVSWNPPANPDPFADRATAGGAGMMRVSGAFAARLSALGQGDRTLTGYRLPTEAEMEYATRAGALTSRYFGETDELLAKYAWYVKNGKERSWPVGSLKPNDLGLFDVQGNVYTWCQESLKAYPTKKDEVASEDREDGLVVNGTNTRVLRGG